MRTGTTSLGPMYPMMPHIVASLSWLSAPDLVFPFFDPALEVPLLAGADRQRAGRHVFPNRGSRSHVRLLADGDRRDQLRVAADERPAFDGRRVLAGAVVVAGDRAGADVHVVAD